MGYKQCLHTHTIYCDGKNTPAEMVKAAMENAYRSAGWNLTKSENPHGEVFPSFVDVALEVEKYINQSEYSEENKSNYKTRTFRRSLL